MPRDRVGALPYPGMFTLYRTADANDLGVHRYEQEPRLFHDETAGGIIYTTRAGFLDVAHIRITVDTVRYCAARLRAAIDRGEAVVPLSTLEGSKFYAALHYPPNWPAALRDPGERKIAEEVALRVGQRIAYRMMTWHEVATWFGYRTISFVDEQPSAFSYDDTMSHVVGLRIAGVVLRTPQKEPFDRAVTAALRDELAALGAVAPDQTDAAAAAVEGYWWSHGRPLRRQLDVGLSDDLVRPWLISMISPGAENSPEAFHLPTLHDVQGRDFSNFATVTLEPRIRAADAMREQLPGRPRVFDVENDFPALIAAIRTQLREQWGSDADSPNPAASARAHSIRPPAAPSHAGAPPKTHGGDVRVDTTRGTHG